MANLRMSGVPPACDAGNHQRPTAASFEIVDEGGEVVAYSCKRHAAGALERQQDSEDAAVTPTAKPVEETS